MKLQEMDQQLLAHAGTQIKYHPGQNIQLELEGQAAFYFLQSGRIRAYFLDELGREATVEVIGSGRILGESSLLSRSDPLLQFEAVSEVCLVRLSQQSLDQLLQHKPQLAWPIMQMLIETIQILTRQVERLTLLNASHRLADLLAELVRDPDPSLAIEKQTIPYSHDNLAAVSNLQRPTVSRLLKDFESRGWIQCGYGCVQVLDRKALYEYAWQQ